MNTLLMKQVSVLHISAFSAKKKLQKNRNDHMICEKIYSCDVMMSCTFIPPKTTHVKLINVLNC